MSNKYLFLDDVHMPIDAYGYTKFELFKDKEWDVVRNYNEFVRYIEENGLPKFISFDHDLVDDGKTGAHCAEYLTDYCIMSWLELPEYYCHSMNPVGKNKIVNTLESFEQRKNFLGISTDDIVSIFERRFIGDNWIVKSHTSPTLWFEMFYKTTPEYKYKRGMRKSYSKHKKKKS
jgi:hypothetical protein